MDLLLVPDKSQPSFPDSAAEHSAMSNEIDNYLCKMLTLKTYLNISSHVNNLPSEILAQIFVAYARDHYQSATRHWNKPTFANLQWIKLSHVCRHWRNVAFNAPRFWSHIYVRRPETFCRLLPLSKSSPLYIDLDATETTWMDGTRAWDSGIELIGQQSHRLRELCYLATSKQVRLLADKLSHPMGLLEKLELSCGISGFPDIEPLHLLPPGGLGQPPRLHYLAIRHLPVVWTDPVFCSTLTTLIVVGFDSSLNVGTPGGNFEQFLDALQAMAPSLVHLTLEDCVPRIPLAASELLPSIRAIALPRLQHLKLVGITDDCVSLMDRLLMNPAAKLTLMVLGVAGIPHLVEILSAHVSRTTPLLAMRIFFPGIATWAVHVVGQDDVTDIASIRIDLTLRTSSLDDSLDQPFTAVLKAAKTLFSHVKTLYVRSSKESDMSWQRLFRRTTSLEILDVTQRPGPDFLKALCNVQRKKTVGSSRPRWHVPLRRLCELRFHDVCFHHPRIWGLRRTGNGPEFFDQLLNWATLRCKYKVPLKRIQISECKYATDWDISRLRKVVVDVKWDGKEGSRPRTTGSRTTLT